MSTYPASFQVSNTQSTVLSADSAPLPSGNSLMSVVVAEEENVRGERSLSPNIGPLDRDGSQSVMKQCHQGERVSVDTPMDDHVQAKGRNVGCK